MKKISSLLFVLLLMLASFTAGMEFPRGDVDQDGQVTVADVTCLVDYLLNGTWDDEPVTPPDGHEWVDLGLPSGTLWATRNVGAETPEEYGDYFAWGETEPKEHYILDTYKWWSSGFTKYNSGDIKTELDPEDDAAYVNWGSSWRTPAREQLVELVDNCTWTWMSLNGVNGQLVTGPNGNTIFLPAAGWHTYSLDGVGSGGNYWSRTLCPNGSNVQDAHYLNFNSQYIYCTSYQRNNGRSVRPVRVQ